MKQVKFLSLTLALFAAFSSIAEAKIKVGSMSGQESELVYTAAKIAKDRFNLEVEVVEFDDYVMPNVALAEKEIDANAMQHKPYMDGINKDRGFKLVSAANTFIYPIGAYSKKIKDIKELKDGAKIAFPNDATNGARALIMMHNAGLIKLKDPEDLQASKLDVVENPHKFKLIDADAPSLPRVLEDVDLAFINSNYAVNHDLLPQKDALLVEPKESPYVNIIATREGDENREEIKQFIQSYQTDEVLEVAEKIFKGAAVKGW
ncbi:MAG: MetQ/NlpA family ABC transporter substrate-binding protein [Cardiobacteriaceae bacterium]|nr:MetQ/NlpA family ABC transporter substrate-binding protein [Cardiobacteriaceae bacterium]